MLHDLYITFLFKKESLFLKRSEGNFRFTEKYGPWPHDRVKCTFVDQQ